MLREFRLDNQATARKVGGATAGGLESALLEFLDREADATFIDRFDRAKGIEEQLSVLTEYSRSHPDAFAKKPWLSNLRSFLIQLQRACESARKAKSKIIFARLKDGKTVAEKHSDNALRNSYECLSQILDKVRIVVLSNRDISTKELRETFASTELGKAAEDKDWQEWITLFSSGTTAKNATLVLLEKKTGKKRESITTLCSNARRQHKLTTNDKN